MFRGIKIREFRDICNGLIITKTFYDSRLKQKGTSNLSLLSLKILSYHEDGSKTVWKSEAA